MTQIILDQGAVTKLSAIMSPVQICDAAGAVLGTFTPTGKNGAGKKWGEPDFDEDDLNRQEQANEKRFTTAEVLAHLEKL